MPVGCAVQGSLCYEMSERTAIVRLSQRDISYYSSVDQIYTPGFDLNIAVFKELGYTQDALTTILSYMDAGFFNLFVDVYYDRRNSQWQLCPLPFPDGYVSPNLTYNLTGSALKTVCEPEVTFGELLSTINEYIGLSNTNVAAHLLRLSLRLRELPLPLSKNATGYSNAPGDSSLNQTLTANLGRMVFSPLDLENSRNTNEVTDQSVFGRNRTERWPSLDVILLNLHRRIMVAAIVDTFNGSTSAVDLDPNYVFLNKSFRYEYLYQYDEIPNEFTSGQNYVAQSELSFASAAISGFNPNLEYASATELAFSPVLNFTTNGSTLVNLYEDYTWGWAAGQPSIQTELDRKDMMKLNEILCCALQTTSGWIVGNCLEQYTVLCRHRDNPFDWTPSDSGHTYFDADCPQDYFFDAPRTALEARAARNSLMSHGIDAAWVDVNSLSLPNCWVTGGVRAACPYNIIQSSRNGVALIVVTATISVCLLTAMIYLEWERMRFPLISNPSGKRRRQQQSAAPDGVPT
ncbi:Maintenance of telomere capping protein 6 [Wickerhamiella sorbophila]|uniref:Maintenance of telomere capping protein 6 n=1 Tax=Wickerhamiella sorbophila TaxID=45607 RepID=A0A2T0FG57_9ASCO|nr:Maintenance of telomere capping protein 6 [Wickerhamiella sorbophila]PRT53965.1 Maintenance of telomere capping protein 6 [Wickerhamiella sorbophila]